MLGGVSGGAICKVSGQVSLIPLVPLVVVSLVAVRGAFC